MTIATVELTQQQSYQQTSNQSRKVTLLTPAHNTTNEINNSQPSASSIINRVDDNSVTISSAPEEAQSITYDKPNNIKLQLMVLVLERFLGHELDLTDFGFATSDMKANNKEALNGFGALNSTLSTASTEIINIDGQTFNAKDLLSVEEWHSHEQSLNYQVQGKFIVNEQELSLNYHFALSSERSSYSKIEISAAALKDPLIVQFGSQGLGTIEGHHDFAINQDNTLDKLPIFSGDVGYLVYDKNSNQRADNGGELFGPQTGQGFGELAQLDSNNNGFIDVEDKQFEQLYIWQPSNENDQTEQWLSLREANIQAISLSAINTPFDFYDQQGKIQAQLRQSSFAISEEGYGRGVHQVDVRI